MILKDHSNCCHFTKKGPVLNGTYLRGILNKIAHHEEHEGHEEMQVIVI